MGTLWTAGTDPAPAMMNQYYGFADTVTTTVTATSLANLSSVYTIPAGEPSAAPASSYELCCGGSITWGSTAQALTLAWALNGTAFGSSPTIAAAAYAVNLDIRWTARIRITCVTTGAGGTWLGSMLFACSEVTANINPGTAATNAVTVADSNKAPQGASTASPVTVALRCSWASATGAPTASNYWTTFQKVS